MKIAVPAEKPEMGSGLSAVFGRCPYFMIVEVAAGKVAGSEAVSNPGINQAGGAGTAAAQEIGNLGVEALVAGTVGPKAFAALETLGIDVYESIGGSVQQNVDAFLSGNLLKANPKKHSGLFKK